MGSEEPRCTNRPRCPKLLPSGEVCIYSAGHHAECFPYVPPTADLYYQLIRRLDDVTQHNITMSGYLGLDDSKIHSERDLEAAAKKLRTTADKEPEALVANTGLRPAADVRKEIDSTLFDEDIKDLRDIAKMIEAQKYEGVREVIPRSPRVHNELLKAGYKVDKVAGSAKGPGYWTIRW